MQQMTNMRRVDIPRSAFESFACEPFATVHDHIWVPEGTTDEEVDLIIAKYVENRPLLEDPDFL